MRKIVERFIKILESFGLIKKSYLIEYIGVGFSFNEIYAQSHWKKRSDAKTKYSFLFRRLIDKCLKKDTINEFSLITFYNSRHDPDNVMAMCKIFIDCMKPKKESGITQSGIIIEDNKKYYKLTAIIPDTNLAMNTFQFILISH